MAAAICWPAMGDRGRRRHRRAAGQALAYERTEVASLTVFLEWMQADDLGDKRQNRQRIRPDPRDDGDGRKKGWKRLFVILPDKGRKDVTVKDEIITLEGCCPIWKPNFRAKMAQGHQPHADHALKDAPDTRRSCGCCMLGDARAEEIWLICGRRG